MQFDGGTGTVNVPANATLVDIPITLIDQTLPSVETFSVVFLGLSSNGVALNINQVDNDPSTVYLLNSQPTPNFGPNVSFALGATTITSSGTTDSTTFTATLASANTTSSTVIVLQFAPQGAATSPAEGTDYTTTGDVIVIPENETIGSVTITANDQQTGSFTVTATSILGPVSHQDHSIALRKRSPSRRKTKAAAA